MERECRLIARKERLLALGWAERYRLSWQGADMMARSKYVALRQARCREMKS